MMLDKIKKLIPVSVALVVVATLVIIKGVNQNAFTTDPNETLAQIGESTVLMWNGLGALPAGSKVLDFTLGGLPAGFTSINAVKARFEDLANPLFAEGLKKHPGGWLIYAGDAALSAKAFVILSQLGVKNLKILTFSESGETREVMVGKDSVEKSR